MRELRSPRIFGTVSTITSSTLIPVKVGVVVSTNAEVSPASHTFPSLSDVPAMTI